MTLPRYQWRDMSTAQRERVLARPAVTGNDEIRARVSAIIRDVRDNGDAAVVRLTEQLDGVALDSFKVDDLEFAEAELSLSFTEREAILQAIANIRTFHEAQIAKDIDLETMPGVRCQRIARPLAAVGLYVPAGSAPLPSAAMMLAIPADVAGCPTRVLCTPPDKDGNVHPAILFAAHEAGITDVYKVGGAQAIAAMAYGCESIPKVSKVFGPGNAYVTQAKAEVSADPHGAAQDMPAGPSEVLVIADNNATPAYVAADLLSQAEHGPDSQVILLSDSATLIEHVLLEVEQLSTRLDRADIATAALAHSALIEVSDIAEAIAISNEYAPEHLILNVRQPRRWLDQVRHAGSVFLGRLTPESLGDYCSGTNHVLPTYGYARNYSGLGVEQFMLQMTVQEVSEAGLANVGPTAATLARIEGLAAHELAVTLRLADLDD